MATYVFLAGYAVVAVALFLFSYTQVDLNLTLSRASVVQTLEKLFQHVGYYQRPLSAVFYLGIVVSLFLLYFWLLHFVRKNRVSANHVWRLIFVTTAILVFSYPAAFSYDFFNYMFTAKTVLIYHKNPYAVIPLQFAGVDPWTNFMRWTHLPSAYPPLWIALSLVPYLLGFGYFLSILFATKFMIAGFYLLTCWAITRVMDVVDRQHKTVSLVLFALNPLVLIETLVSGHNDIVLAAFAMLAVWAYVKKDLFLSWFYLSLSVAAKFMTMSLIPVWLLKRNREWMLGAMLLGLLVVLVRREFLGWYWVWIMPFVALLPLKRWISWIAGAVSLGLLLGYMPFLYLGSYNAPESTWRLVLILVPIVLSILTLAVRKMVSA